MKNSDKNQLYSKISVSAGCPLEQDWRSKKGKTRPLPPEGLLANINLNVVFFAKTGTYEGKFSIIPKSPFSCENYGKTFLDAQFIFFHFLICLVKDFKIWFEMSRGLLFRFLCRNSLLASSEINVKCRNQIFREFRESFV